MLPPGSILFMQSAMETCNKIIGVKARKLSRALKLLSFNWRDGLTVIRHQQKFLFTGQAQDMMSHNI